MMAVDLAHGSAQKTSAAAPIDNSKLLEQYALVLIDEFVGWENARNLFDWQLAEQMFETSRGRTILAAKTLKVHRATFYTMLHRADRLEYSPRVKRAIAQFAQAAVEQGLTHLGAVEMFDCVLVQAASLRSQRITEIAQLLKVHRNSARKLRKKMLDRARANS